MSKDKETPNFKLGHGGFGIIQDDHKLKIIFDIPKDFFSTGKIDEPSVLAFVGNSYKDTVKLQMDEITKLLNESVTNNVNKPLCKKILPLMFCFRHYIEVESKLYILVLTNEAWSTDSKNGHDLSMIASVKDSIKIKDNKLIKNISTNYDEIKKNLENLIDKISIEIQAFEKLEPYSSFYKYLCDKDFKFSKEIEVDFDSIFKLIKNTFKLFDELHSKVFDTFDFYELI